MRERNGCMVPISIDDFVKKHSKNNNMKNSDQLRDSLIQAVEDKKNGETCPSCGNEIWAIGSALVRQGCFVCITSDTDSSEDYEIEDVCWS